MLKNILIKGVIKARALQMYKMKRRREDQSAVAYVMENPYIRMCTYAVTIITMIFMCGGIWRDVAASMNDVETLKKWRATADMDLAVTKNDVGSMKKQLDDIHAYLLPEKHHEH